MSELVDARCRATESGYLNHFKFYGGRVVCCLRWYQKYVWYQWYA